MIRRRIAEQSKGTDLVRFVSAFIYFVFNADKKEEIRLWSSNVLVLWFTLGENLRDPGRIEGNPNRRNSSLWRRTIDRNFSNFVASSDPR